MTDTERLDRVEKYVKSDTARIDKAIDSIWEKYPGQPRDYRILSDRDKGMWDGLCWAGHAMHKMVAVIEYLRKTQ